ncbi:hypothetical protein BV20DRAFT_467647 [Pilatotrama ljubarskyi]|nr:hypothetical protein BV20DRAFT_467647 [Pilatotrama ljubarskyi]
MRSCALRITRARTPLEIAFGHLFAALPPLSDAGQVGSSTRRHATATRLAIYSWPARDPLPTRPSPERMPRSPGKGTIAFHQALSCSRRPPARSYTFVPDPLPAHPRQPTSDGTVAHLMAHFASVCTRTWHWPGCQTTRVLRLERRLARPSLYTLILSANSGVRA